MSGSDVTHTDVRVDDALRRAAALETDDWAAAIEVLSEANRVGRNAALEIELVALRHRAASRVVGTDDPEPELAGGTAPAIGPSGLPETTVGALTAADLRAAILEHGSLLVRGVVGTERAHELADAIDRCWSVSSGTADAEGGSDPDAEAIWRPFWPAGDEAGSWVHGIRNWVRAAGGVLLCDSPEIQFEILELYRSLGLQTIVTEYLGSRPVLSANKCTLRRVSPDTVGGWHQDGAFLGRGIRAVNLWLALSDCGTDAPGMDLVSRRLDDVVETGGPDAYFDWAAGDAAVARAAGSDGIVRPEFRAGDVLIFDDLMLHRTATEPTMTADRRAIELWSFSAAAYPEGHIKIVW